MIRRAFHSWSQSVESYVAGCKKTLTITVPLHYLPSPAYRIQSCVFDPETKRVQIIATAEETLPKKKAEQLQ